MCVRMGLCLAVMAVMGVACLGPSQPADNTCESLGGVCVTGNGACGGSLPYSCDQGTCCTPTADAGAASSSGDSGESKGG